MRPALAKLGIQHLRDVTLHLPMRYEDQTRVVPIGELLVGESVVVEGVVDHSETLQRPRRQFVALLRSSTDDGVNHLSPRLSLRYFNFYPSTVSALKPGNTVRVYGEIREGYYGLEMVHPIFKKANEPQAPSNKALTPVYPSSAGVPQAALRTLATKALKLRDVTAELVPPSILQAQRLTAWDTALGVLHSPAATESAIALEGRTHPAWRRVKFDELLAQQLSLRDAKLLRAAETAPSIAPTGSLSALLLQRLPFQLTAAQNRAVAEALSDMNRGAPMTRLLQGDVGSGKTIVAALAALATVEAGYQVAFMAPTELLAAQHFNKLSHWLHDLPVKLTWLTGSLTAAEQKAAHESCAKGETHIAIGTHALFQKKVSFARLGLVVVDEQHRFGVEQRLQLRQRGTSPPPPGGEGLGERELALQTNSDKSGTPSPQPSPPGGGSSSLAPHTLMMSATPIPRSLAMSYYADLDVSIIDELPGGRQPITTKLVSENRRAEIAGRIYEIAQTGAQAYWVCPLIEESDKMEIELQNATALYTDLVTMMPNVRVALLHGRMKAEEKAEIMANFIANKVQVLVSTTVIEVGVDVPNASWMVIEHAERFGLAQLHQLRGRIGRGAAASTCILLFADKLSDTAKQRLKVIYENIDGFVIAREDLRIRGPGELLGPRQSGLPSLRYANIEEDIDLVEAVRDLAPKLEHDPNFNKLAFLNRWIKNRVEFAKA
ncbi:MAG: ATP-dependent DNA helicase RecG [Betaproteobacteria bacterium]|nr:MAG: ATP-dependent DNA helicase RecG [Betaproteobacteria bacterium]